MLPSFIITFRETLEITLIVGVILSYLYRTRQVFYNKVVYWGLFFGIVVSMAAGFVLNQTAGAFVGRSEAVFEGAMMLFGAALLTSMIFWMLQQKQVAQKLESRVIREINKPHVYGLFLLVFVSVLREGVETVIFLNAAALVSAGHNLLGIGLGMALAVVLGYLLFKGFMKVKIKYFFNATSILLIMFAAGLVAHGVHEFHEAGILPPIVHQVWDINPAPLADGSFPLLHEKGHVGSLLKGLLGYNANPSLLEIFSYTAYLGLVFLLWRKVHQQPTVNTTV